MIIQRQKWLNFRRIVIFDNHGSVQLELHDKPMSNQNIEAYVNEHSFFYAPTAEEAGKMCKKHNTIDIIEVKEVSYE